MSFCLKNNTVPYVTLSKKINLSFMSFCLKKYVPMLLCLKICPYVTLSKKKSVPYVTLYRNGRPSPEGRPLSY